MNNKVKLFFISVALSACTWESNWDGSYEQLSSDGKECVASWLAYKDSALDLSHTIQSLDFNVEEILAVKVGATGKIDYDFIAVIKAKNEQYLLFNNPLTKEAELHEIKENLLEKIEPELVKVTKLNKKLITGKTANWNHVYCDFYYYYDGKTQHKLAYIGYFDIENELTRLLFKLRSKYMDKEAKYLPLKEKTEMEMNTYEQRLKQNLFYELGVITHKK